MQLIRLKKCKGRAECWGEIDVNEQAIQSSIWEQIFGRYAKSVALHMYVHNFHISFKLIDGPGRRNEVIEGSKLM